MKIFCWACFPPHSSIFECLFLNVAAAGDATDIKYQEMTNCDLQMVGDEFSRKPYAVAVQQGSPLKDQFNDA